MQKYSLLRWGGGKYYSVNQIVPFVKPKANFAEIFGGSLVITLNLPRGRKTEVVNDINKDLYNFWNIIRTKPDEFTERIKYVFNGELWHGELMDENTDVSLAVAFYLRNRNSYSGFGDTGKIRYSFSNNPLWKDISWWADRLRDVRIYNLDFKDILKRLNKLTTDWVLYCDPPYYEAGAKGEFMYVDAGQKKDVGFLPEDHAALSELLKDSPHDWILSYDDCPEVRDLYEGFYFRTFRKTYCGSSSNKKKVGGELLVSNKKFQQYGTSKLSSFGTSK